jgi:hypothetical protein
MTLTELAGWIAPAATMIAAMMTAANLGARLTGWGFVVFTIGSIGWTMVGLSSGQMNLVASNGFLTLINAVGIWRWLGKQLAYEEGGKSAKVASRRAASPTLFTATGLGGMKVVDENEAEVGTTVEALLSCKTGEVSYIVIASGGIGGVDETLRAVSHKDIEFGCDQLKLRLSRAVFMTLAPLSTADWPAQVDGS